MKTTFLTAAVVLTLALAASTATFTTSSAGPCGSDSNCVLPPGPCDGGSGCVLPPGPCDGSSNC